MYLVGYIICLFYFWYGYKIFMSKTFGSFIFQLVILLLSMFLYFTAILYIFRPNPYLLLLPIIPYTAYGYFNYTISKKMNKIIYKKN